MNPLRPIGRALARHLSRPRPGTGYAPTSSPAALLATLGRGDVLLVDGTSRFSSTIKYLTQSTWSHASLCIGQHGGELTLVEADINDGVRLLPAEDYVGYHTRICRPVGLAPDELDRVIAHATDRLGHQYDVRNIVDLLRFLLIKPPLPARWRRRWLALGSGDPTRAICSSLIAEAFQSVRYPILPEPVLNDSCPPEARSCQRELLHIRHHSLFAPRDFDISPYFEVVKPTLAQGFDPGALAWAESAEPDNHRPSLG